MTLKGMPKSLQRHLLISDEMVKEYKGKSAEAMAKSLNLPLDLLLTRLNCL